MARVNATEDCANVASFIGNELLIRWERLRVLAPLHLAGNANVASNSWKGERRLPQRRHFSPELLPLIKAGSSMPMEGERERGQGNYPPLAIIVTRGLGPHAAAHLPPPIGNLIMIGHLKRSFSFLSPRRKSSSKSVTDAEILPSSQVPMLLKL